MPAVLLAAACAPKAGTPDAANGALTVDSVWASAPAGAQEIAVYLTIQNPMAGPDTLLEATAPEAGSVMPHRNVVEGGLVRMEHLDVLTVGGGERLTLAPGGTHLMVSTLVPRSPGDTLHLALVFARAGLRAVSAVIREPGS